ncbi:MAG: hypothetical protein AMXMBFR8_31120 [Nevskiales bacterium]
MSERSDSPMRHPLTEEDMVAFRPRAAIVGALEARRSRLGLPREEMTVVDWGCGRGELTLWLREQGWRAFGIDVAGDWVENGRALARQRGLPAEEILLIFDDSYRAPFPDQSVEFISSDQVLEHVEDIEAFARETGRVLKTGGEALHVYPGHRRLIEGHLFMPLVQFTPKSALRHALIRACVALGMEPKNWEFDDLPASARARRYYEYSCNNTFYRTPDEVEAAFASAGFEIDFDVRTIRGVQSRPWAKTMLEHRVTAGLLSWALLYFGAINLRCCKTVTPRQ